MNCNFIVKFESLSLLAFRQCEKGKKIVYAFWWVNWTWNEKKKMRKKSCVLLATAKCDMKEWAGDFMSFNLSDFSSCLLAGLLSVSQSTKHNENTLITWNWSEQEHVLLCVCKKSIGQNKFCNSQSTLTRTSLNEHYGYNKQTIFTQQVDWRETFSLLKIFENNREKMLSQSTWFECRINCYEKCRLQWRFLIFI
jgi:hypothetical protein